MELGDLWADHIFGQALATTSGVIAVLNHFAVDLQTLFMNGVTPIPNIKWRSEAASTTLVQTVHHRSIIVCLRTAP